MTTKFLDNKIWETSHLPLPQKDPKLKPWSEFPLPGNLDWGDLSFGLSFARTTVWVSPRKVRNTGAGVDEICIENLHIQIFTVVAFPKRNRIFGRFSSLPPTPPVKNIWAAAQIILPKFLPISFSSVHLVLQVFRDIWPSNKENPSACWHATLSCPFMASNYANSYLVPISFWSRSGCWPCLEFFLSDLVFQACISFYSVLDKSGAWMFLPCLIKNVVAHILYFYCRLVVFDGPKPGFFAKGFLLQNLVRGGKLSTVVPCTWEILYDTLWRFMTSLWRSEHRPGSIAKCRKVFKVRKILVSVKFVSAILGPEMGASILWTPGKMRSFCRKNACP